MAVIRREHQDITYTTGNVEVDLQYDNGKLYNLIRIDCDDDRVFSMTTEEALYLNDILNHLVEKDVL